jgi:hypothetical protein
MNLREAWSVSRSPDAIASPAAPRERPQPCQGDRAEDRARGRDGAHEYPAGEW